MAVKLTDALIKTAKGSDKRYTMFDSGGLYLEVSPNGGKWWRFRYFLDEKKKVLSFGIYPEVSLKSAREKRDEARVLLANGGDPGETRKEHLGKNDLPTFASVAEEWFGVKSAAWAQRHAITVRQRLDKYLIPNLRNKPFAELGTPDFLKILRTIEGAKKYEMAKRVAQICGQVCRFAKLSGIIKYNPVESISEILTPPKTKHFATITDPKRIGQLMRDIQRYPGNSSTSLALRMMPYVFVRSGELRGAKWEEFDFDSATWIIQAERMKMRKPHVVPLAPQVVKILEELKALSGDSHLCFPSPMSKTRCITDICLLNALRRIGYEREEMCVHGFRSMASTLLNEQGYRPDIIEAQLAHKEPNAIRDAYNRAQYLDERRKMMHEWADYLDKLRRSEIYRIL